MLLLCRRASAADETNHQFEDGRQKAGHVQSVPSIVLGRDSSGKLVPAS